MFAARGRQVIGSPLPTTPLSHHFLIPATWQLMAPFMVLGLLLNGLATLELIQAPGFHDALERRTHQLCDGLEAAAREAGIAFTTTRSCAMFGLYFTDQHVETYDQAVACDTAAFNRFFHGMLKRGVYLAPSAFEAGFLSSAHGDIEIAHTLAAAAEAFREARAG